MVDKRDPFFVRAMDATMDFIFGEDDSDYYYVEEAKPQQKSEQKAEQKAKPEKAPHTTSSVIFKVNGKKFATCTLEPGEHICISIDNVKADSL